MLYDTSPHNMRSIAFAIYNKAAGSQLSGPIPASAAQAMCAGSPEQAAAESAAPALARNLTTQNAAAKSTKVTDTAASQLAGSANNGVTCTAGMQQQQPHRPALLAWVGCCAGAPAFRVADDAQSCTLASAASEPGADPDLDKVLRSTGPAATTSAQDLETDKERCGSCDLNRGH